MSLIRKYQSGSEFNYTPRTRQGDTLIYGDKPSTHLMAREYIEGKGWVAFPTLFQNEDGKWVDMTSKHNKDEWGQIYEEAKNRGETYEFGEDEKAAIDFADDGSWKKKKDRPFQYKKVGRY